MPEAELPLLHEPLPIFLTILAVILIAPLLSLRLRLPGIVGLVVGGIIIGPYGFKLLDTEGIVELFSIIGLIYLMFNAGLEIDLGQFNRVRARAILFGALTFIIPLIGGTLLGRWLGFTWGGAILLGSALSSHTLIAFPILTRLGVVNNETVSVTVGATVFTDISAFIVLAVITGVSSGDADAGEFLSLFALMAALAVGILVILPRVGKRLFQYLRGRDVEFQYVLVILLVAALLAELIGIHAVVGAFLTGLAINSMLPRHSQVIGRILFVGEALFIPSFLVYSGMITDPLAFVGGEALVIGVAMTVIAYGAKYAAAVVTARIFGYNRDELWTMWGLSQCQAAVTLPTILVGVEAGLFPQAVFNGTMMMILATSITSPLLVQHFGKRLRRPEIVTPPQSLFERVMLAISNPETQDNMIALMQLLTQSKGGKLLALNVALASPTGSVAGLAEQDRAVNAEALRHEEVTRIERVDDSLARGILYSATEQNATLISLGWRGKPTLAQNIFGTVLDEVLWKARVPVMVLRVTRSITAFERVLMVIEANSTAPTYLDEMTDAALSVATSLNAPLLVISAKEYDAEVRSWLERLNHDHPYQTEVLESASISALEGKIRASDLVLLSTTGTRQRFQSSLSKIPEELARRTRASLAIIHYPA